MTAPSPSMHVLGRPPGEDGPTATFGSFRARDGSLGATVGLDLDGPHAGLVVGKRGSGKSYTLGVVAEAAADAPGVAPVVVDPMDAFAGLADGEGEGDIDARVLAEPRVEAGAIPPRAWPSLLDLDPTGAAGSLVWRAASAAEPTTVARMRERVADAGVDPAVRRAADNHLALAASWDAFDPEGLDAGALLGGEATVLDCSGIPPAAAGALCFAVARGLYDARVRGASDRLPWLLVDEAHAFFDGVAAPALRTLLTRGRAPGVSLVAATQRPSALPAVAVSQADLLVAHRLTSEADVRALRGARPTYLAGDLDERLPRRTGEALVVDDVTETANVVRVRERRTPHGGGSPRASRAVEGAQSAR